MRRLVIAVDCDDVLVPSTPFFIDNYNKLYGTSLSLEDAHTGSEDSWQADRVLIEDRLAQLMETEEYKLLAPSEEAIRVLRELAEHHDLHVVTARREQEREMTQRMLDYILPGVFHSLDTVGWTGSKGEVCQRLCADILIDDSARHLHDAIACGMPKQGAILFGEYPWNRNDGKHEDLTVCPDWLVVKVVVDAIAEEPMHA